jgi:hypothetical protein
VIFRDFFVALTKGYGINHVLAGNLPEGMKDYKAVVGASKKVSGDPYF